MYNRARSNLELTREKLEHTRNFFEKEDWPETVHFIWVVFENCINIIKDVKNNRPLYEHRAKVDLFSVYYGLNHLKKDYSLAFSLLLRLRIRADFGDYSNAPLLPPKGKIKEYLKLAEELFAETAEMLR